MSSLLRILFILLLSCTLIHLSSSSSHARRLLHQPFYPLSFISPSDPPSFSFSSLPQQALNDQPKQPSLNSPPTNVPNSPFFPSISSSPPLPPPSQTHPSSVAVTIPANISSLILPQSPSRKSVSPKLLAFTALASSFSIIFVLALIFFYRRRNRRRFSTGNDKTSRSDNLRMFSANSVTSDGGHKLLRAGVPASDTTSSEFLYMLNPHGVADESNNVNTDSETVKVGSPELLPLPPLPRRNVIISAVNDEEDEFYSPRASSSTAVDVENLGSSANPASPASSYPSSCSASPAISHSTSYNSPTPSMDSSHHPPKIESFSKEHSPKVAPPAPPPPPPSNIPLATQGPPLLITPTRPIKFQNTPPLLSPHGHTQNVDGVATVDDTGRPKLKPLHWDKVRAKSDGAMAWDQLNSNSFKLNEEMIESLFMANGSNLVKDKLGRAVSLPTQQNQVLNPKKSQNIAILLKALNVTVDEVCEALLEGNADTLGTEFLESLLKMAPTKEEERRIRDFKDESSVKLGPAERFLRAVINVPFAFRRVDAMLYIANFDYEVEYLRRSFKTLEVACEELRNSRMFMKLLEAVLRSGNRMNVGTNRGDARAFKLDTLLKLVDVKGGDGKTTLLHFVVQEIIRAEGENHSHHPTTPPQSALRDELEFRKRGLQVVSGLSGELENVKKAAALDYDVLGSEVGKLGRGVSKVKEVLDLMEEPSWEESSRRGRKFCDSMDAFLQKAEEEIVGIEVQGKAALCSVKDLTVYFHGDSGREEAHPLRIFKVVSDFLHTLDHVCREVGKINERSIVSAGRTFSKPPPLPVFFGFNPKQQQHHPPLF